MVYFNFTRCRRADGTHYGTAGICRKGSEDPLDTINKLIGFNIKEGSGPLILKNKIGEGEYARVYDIGDNVVVKIGEIRSNETKAMETLSHLPEVPRIIASKVEDQGKTNSILAMSKVPGTPVSQFNKADRAEIYDNLILPALYKIHKAGIAHNDFHGNNILMNRDNSNRRNISIIDFGKAKFNDPEAVLWDLRRVSWSSSPNHSKTIKSVITKHKSITTGKKNPKQQIEDIWKDLGFN